MIVIGNWKMNFLKVDAINLVNSINYQAKKTINVVICPPVILIPYILDLLKKKKILVGAQDCSSELVGAFTGDVSAEMLKDSECSFVIVGHSERRNKKVESSNMVKCKSSHILNFGMIPVICVGESLDIRNKSQHFEFIEKQVLESLPETKYLNNSKIIIAYEPIWAIGSGEVASNNEISEMHKFIKYILKKSKIKNATDIEVIYGGSVKSSNAKNVLSSKYVDGVLVGGASLDADEFNKIINCVIY